MVTKINKLYFAYFREVFFLLKMYFRQVNLHILNFRVNLHFVLEEKM